MKLITVFTPRRTCPFLSLILFILLAFKTSGLLAYVPISDEQLFEHTPLMKAVSEGDHAKVKKLLDSGHSSDELSESGGTALMVAARSAQRDMVELLIQHDADPNNCGTYNYCPLWYAADADSLEIIKSLVSAGAKPKWVPVNNGTEYPPLQLAVKNNNIQMVKYLVEAGADMEFSNYWSNYAAPTPLSVAVAQGHLDMVKYLLSRGALIHEATETAYRMNTTALAYARSQGHLDVVRYIESALSQGANKPRFTVEMFVEKLFKDPNYQLLSENRLAVAFLDRVSMDSLRLLRNSIYARKNFKFSDDDVRRYFADKFPSYEGNTRQVTVSDIDEKNIDFIKTFEQRAYNRSIAS